MTDTPQTTGQAPAPDLPLLRAAPVLMLRKERVDVPELGGSVIVRGLTASEGFAVEALRHQATLRVRREMQERSQAGAASGSAPGLPQDAQADDAPEMQFDEWAHYGSATCEMLARAVLGEQGLALYTAQQWDAVGQHHPGAFQRLAAVASRLSGFNAEDVRKNSAPNQS